MASAEDQEVPRAEKNELNLRVFSCGVEDHQMIKEEWWSDKKVCQI